MVETIDKSIPVQLVLGNGTHRIVESYVVPNIDHTV